MPLKAMTLPAPSPCVTIWWRETRCQMSSLSKTSEPTTSGAMLCRITSAMAVGLSPICDSP